MHRIIKAFPTKDFHLILEFDSGECRVVDVEPFIKGTVFEPLKDINIFRKVRVDEFLGTVVWLDEVDLCPDTLYMKSRPLNLDNDAVI